MKTETRLLHPAQDLRPTNAGRDRTRAGEVVASNALQPDRVRVWLKPAADHSRMAVDGSQPALLPSSPVSER